MGTPGQRSSHRVITAVIVMICFASVSFNISPLPEFLTTNNEKRADVTATIKLEAAHNEDDVLTTDLLG